MDNIKKESYPSSFVAWSRNFAERFYSTSGGIFFELANAIIKNGGFVVGAAYNEKLLVNHIMVNSLDEISLLQQSKYVCSSLNRIYIDIENKLKSSDTVLFCGSPCQVSGLLSYLGKTYENLYTVDFICRGINSKKAYLSWINEIESVEMDSVEKVWFKYKEGGWKTSPTRTRIDFKSGKTKIFFGNENKYMFGYLNSNLFLRPSCGLCRFKGQSRKSDITIGDFWGLDPKFDDDKGASLVIINSYKGKDLFSLISDNITCIETNFQNSVENNPMYSQSIKLPFYRKKFLLSLDKNKFSFVFNKYFKRQCLLNRIKGIKNGKA